MCGAETRGRGERRGPLSFQAGNLWKCWAGGCNAGGDALGLLAALRFQTIPPKGDARWHALLMELEGKSICHQIPKPLTKLEIPAAVFPPHLQVQQLWQACITLDDPKAMQSVAFRWLADYRKLDPISMGALHLARILPRHLPEWPDWIPTLGIPRQNWLGIYRLVTPLYDATGLLRALRFRAVDRWWQAGQWLPPQGCHQDDRGTLFFGSQRLPKALSPRGVREGW